MTAQDVPMEELGPRSLRRHRFLVALPIVAIAVAIGMTITAAASARLSEWIWLMFGSMVAFTSVGAIIEDRRPGQVVGRICLTIGVLGVVSALFLLAAIAIDSQPGRLPPHGAILAVASSTIFTMGILLGGPLLISRFPDGRGVGRSAVFLDGLFGVVCLFMLAGAMKPGPIEYGWIEAVDNPLGVDAVGAMGDDGVFSFIPMAYIVPLILVCVGLGRRYMRGNSIVRAQIRWFAAAIGASIVAFGLLLATTGNQSLTDVFWRAWILSFLLPPLAIGIAILRYRLFDIDRIVSRSIAYAVVTGILVATYIGAILILQGPLGAVVGGNTVSVALSTLVVAALFQPLRRRIQAIVDRRFDRGRIDADRTTSAFSERMRDEVDIDTVTTDLRDTVHASVRPVRLGVWLREVGR